MNIEAPRWMDRTSIAISERTNTRIPTKDYGIRIAEKSEEVKRTLQMNLKFWDRLQIDKTLEEIGKVFNLKVQGKWIAGPLLDLVKVDPRKKLASRVLENLRLQDENLTTIRRLGIETRVGSEFMLLHDFSYFHFSLRPNEILISSAQPEPHKGNYNITIGITENLGSPQNIKSPEILRDRIDGYLANLIRKYPTFCPSVS